MPSMTRKVDSKARVTLPENFAGRVVVVDQVKEDEVRIHLVKERRRVASLDRLLAGVTRTNRHGEIDSGPPVGAEK